MGRPMKLTKKLLIGTLLLASINSNAANVDFGSFILSSPVLSAPTGAELVPMVLSPAATDSLSLTNLTKWQWAQIGGVISVSSSGYTSLNAGSTGTGSFVLATNPILVTPNLGTPSAVVLTNATGVAPLLTSGYTLTNANLSGDVSSVGNTTTLATVNPSVGSFTNASITVNAKGLVTAASSGTNGTVSGVSVVPANGMTGTVSNPTTTPAITLSTSVTGLVKGNGTAFSAATAGTDYSVGTSGLSTGIVKSTTGTGALSIATVGDFPILNQNTTGNAANVTGTVAFANGGTGATSQPAAITALAGTQASGYYLRSNGTNTVLSAIQAADVPILNQNTTGNAATVTTNANLTGDVTSTGNVTTVGKINGTSLSGLTTGILKNTTGTGVPSIAVAADFPILNQSTTGTAANVTGVVAIANGGTGQATQATALTSLSGTQVAGRYLRSDGTNTSLSAIQAVDVPTLNQSTTGNAATATNLAGGLANEIPYQSAANTTTYTGTGTTGQVLTANASGVPTWVSPIGGGTVTSVTFTGDGTVLSLTPSSAVTTSGTVTATLAVAGPGTLLNNATGTSAAPTYTSTPVLGQNAVTTGTIGLASSSGATTTIQPSSIAVAKTITLPANTGTLIGTGDTGTVSNAMLTNSSMTIAGHSIALGGTQTLAYGDLSSGAPTATASALGLVRPDNSTIAVSGGILTATNPYFEVKLAGANLNTTTDQAITGFPAKYMITGIYMTNASGSVTTAVGGIYTAASKVGSQVIYSGQSYSALTTASSLLGLTFATGALETAYTAGTLYLSLTTPQGAAMTADVYVMGVTLQ